MIDTNKFEKSWRFVEPPGYYRSVLKGKNDEEFLKVDIFDNHRFLFFSLIYESRHRCPLNLISIDYHQDLAPLSVLDKENLKKLDRSNDEEVAFFTWNYINPSNDNHILLAVYLNLIKDVIVLCKDRSPDMFCFKDKNSGNHQIVALHDKETFLKKIKSFNENILLDIDLDFFVEKSMDKEGREIIEYKKQDTNFQLFNPESILMRHCKGKVKLITIAKEPEH